LSLDWRQDEPKITCAITMSSAMVPLSVCPAPSVASPHGHFLSTSLTTTFRAVSTHPDWLVVRGGFQQLTASAPQSHRPCRCSIGGRDAYRCVPRSYRQWRHMPRIPVEGGPATLRAVLICLAFPLLCCPLAFAHPGIPQVTGFGCARGIEPALGKRTNIFTTTARSDTAFGMTLFPNSQ